MSPAAVQERDEVGVLATNSTATISDMQIVINAGPTAQTAANSVAAAGPIHDYIGDTKLIQEKLQEIATLMSLVVSTTDAADPSLAKLQGIQQILV